MPLAHALRRGAAALLATLAATAVVAQNRSGTDIAPREPGRIPEFFVVAPRPEARLPVRVESVNIQGRIVGEVARTRVEVVLHNPNARVLEGEMTFPLADGAVVSGFALDIDGVLRPAVAVPKAQGRMVFDDVTRARTDPALLSATQGNNYKLRVYPLPPRGRRTVVLEIEQTLADKAAVGGRQHKSFAMPLAFGTQVERLDMDIAVVGEGLQVTAGALSQPLRVRAVQPQLTQVQATLNRFEGQGPLWLDIRSAAQGSMGTTEAFRGKTYAYAQVPVPVHAAPRPLPKVLGLVWDASGSGAQRERGRELALLDAYFAALRDVEVRLKVVRDGAEPVRSFRIRGGEWSELRAVLSGMVYDGATNAAEMGEPEGVDLALVVSDGLGNYGAGSWPQPAVPLLAVVAADTADASALAGRAQDSGGALVRLAAQDDAKAAAEKLLTQPTRLLRVESDGLADVVTGGVPVRGGVLRLAAVMERPQASAVLVFRTGDGSQVTRRVGFKAEGAGAASPGVAASQWARLKLAALESEPTLHGKEIERLGMHFGRVTSRTSLLVLDAAADYARYNIEPPAADARLHAQWEELVARAQQHDRDNEQSQLERVARQFAQRVAWWEKDFSHTVYDEPAKAAPPSGAEEGLPAGADREREMAARRQRATETAREARAPRPAAAAAPMPAPVPLAIMAAPAAAPAPSPGAGAAPDAPTDAAVIRLQKWQPDSAYAQRMRGAATAREAYAFYLDERPSHLQSTAFFLDAADVLLDKGDRALAARVVSNLAEMALENRHILRILAYRLQQAGRVSLALPLLERVRDLAPDEPQSWRDLGLALAAAGQAQRAVDSLWHVVRHPWNGRFPGIELIALGELNAVANAARARGETVDTSAIPAALQRHLPVGLRAVLAWDADNTDIDLWVTDPKGEQAYYGHRETRQGGLMSMDFTGGYGPEEFLLRRPLPGTYKVEAKFFGHRQQVVQPYTTLMLQLSTGFGLPQQHDQSVTLRLQDRGDGVTIGEFTVGPQP
jgi:hypothetical protein